MVGTLSTVDEDEEDTHTYVLLGGDTSFFELDGSDVLVKKSPDYEVNRGHNILIATVDKENLSFSEYTVIDVENLIDHPSSTENSVFSSLKLYPNAVTEQELNISLNSSQMGEVEVVLRSIGGQKVFEDNFMKNKPLF